MELTGRERRYILLFSLIALIIPMVIFPYQLGTELAKASLINAFYELVFYGIVIFIFNSRVTLVNLLQACGACLVYRFAMGAVFGVLVAIAYNLDLRTAVTMGMSSYLPAIILHVIGAPLILRPALSQIYQRRPRRLQVSRPRPDMESTVPGETAGAAPRTASRPSRRSESAASGRSHRGSAPSAADIDAVVSVPGDGWGFDRAVEYVGEHGSVQLACVVDHEGLLMANYRRGAVDAEEWAPLALLFIESNAQVTGRGDLGQPNKVTLTLEETRIDLARVNTLVLMVLAERQSDDLLNIRINQAIEMIGKFHAERYGAESVANAERTHVSSVE